MQLTCPACQRTLDFTADAPSYCSYCGNSLAKTLPLASLTTAEAATLAPRGASGNAGAGVQQTVGGYRLLRALGAGGMGEVYEAEESASGRRVALKIINASYADSSEEAVERFRQEGRLASMVTSPRCVFVLAAREEGGRPYIVMELMPGQTLHDLVKDNGPLPPEQAIAKILDVIDGLQAAHRLEVIHRDVKPSNCFLEADGRVKVGDFGLAKSLAQGGSLTQTGAFVGTLLFASPEQIRGEGIDLRTDVYSTAATLYFLLTGQAPFQSTDMAATLARIVSDPAPSMRRLRPEVPAALDQAVLQGLERDPNHRWPDLESFREALVALIPSPLTRETWGRRIVAGVEDAIVCSCVSLALLWALSLLSVVLEETLEAVLYDCWSVALAILYFTVLEHGWGRSLGKRHQRLLVCPVEGHDPPTGRWALARSAAYCCLPAAGPLTMDLWHWMQGTDSAGGWAWLWWALWVLGWIVLAVPMRPANGYRGLHEWLSGTRVMQLPFPKQRTALGSTGPWLMYFLAARRLDQQVPQRTSFPERVGGFSIRGVLKWTASDKILLGEDAALGRRVFLWFRPASESPLDQSRREIGRRTRLRWLASGRQGDLQWDAMLAPLGCPLPELIASDGKLSPAELQPILAELTGELAAACADGTLPRALNAALVWVQHDSSAQLADIALTEPSAGASAMHGTDHERAQALLREVTVLALAEKHTGQDAKAQR
jgi:eukaryotic-like serine/threonine-protein kinase